MGGGIVGDVGISSRGGEPRDGRGRRDADSRGFGLILRREGLAVLTLVGAFLGCSSAEEHSLSSDMPGIVGGRERRGIWGDATELRGGRRAFGGGGDGGEDGAGAMSNVWRRKIRCLDKLIVWQTWRKVRSGGRHRGEET
jgi:hypothetical protein